MATIVITGANRGIGLELARQRAEGNEVIALVRRASPELSALGVRVEEGVDVTDGATVAAAADKIGSVDILINNAGILQRTALPSLDWDSIRAQMEVNAFGPLRVCAAFAPKMGEGGKIALVTSRMGSIDDNSSGGSYGYRMSKCALNMAGMSLAHDLRDRGIGVALLHPGFVRTEMTGGRGNLDADESARGLWARIDELELATSGTFWHSNGEVLPW